MQPYANRNQVVVARVLHDLKTQQSQAATPQALSTKLLELSMLPV